MVQNRATRGKRLPKDSKKTHSKATCETPEDLPLLSASSLRRANGSARPGGKGGQVYGFGDSLFNGFDLERLISFLRKTSEAGDPRKDFLRQL